MLAYYPAAPQQPPPQRQYEEVDEALEHLVRSIDVPVGAGVPTGVPPVYLATLRSSKCRALRPPSPSH